MNAQAPFHTLAPKLQYSQQRKQTPVSMDGSAETPVKRAFHGVCPPPVFDITYHNIWRNSHSAVWTDAIRQFGRIPFGSLDDQISPRLFHRPRGNSRFAWSPTCSSCLLSLRGVSESRSMVKRASCSFPLPNERTSPFPHPGSQTPILPAAKANPSFNGWIRRNPRKTRVSRGPSPCIPPARATADSRCAILRDPLEWSLRNMSRKPRSGYIAKNRRALKSLWQSCLENKASRRKQRRPGLFSGVFTCIRQARGLCRNACHSGRR